MADLELYHISCLKYENGSIAPDQDINSYHTLTVQKGFGWVNDFLDSIKPSTAPSRKKAYYACDSISNCMAYGKSKKCDDGGPYLYRVKMKNPCKVPMSLVNTIFKKGETNRQNTIIGNEYWSPTQVWNYFEFLSEEMEIVEEIGIKREYYFSPASNLISKDQDLAKKIYP